MTDTRLNPGDLTWDGLKALGEVNIFDRTEEKDILTRSKGAEVILTNKTPLTAETLKNLKADLKYVGVLATGYNCGSMLMQQRHLAFL